MKLFLAASVNPFDLKAALLAGHAQQSQEPKPLNAHDD